MDLRRTLVHQMPARTWTRLAKPFGLEMVDLTWAEIGGPVVAGPPKRSGFGTRLLQRGLAGDLGPAASVNLRFEPGGLRAVLRFRPGGRPAQQA